MVSIGIRYCGGCNPRIERSGVITSLKKALRKMGMEVDFTANRQGAVDIVLLINGCIHACLEEAYPKEGRTTPYISLKGEMVDDEYVVEKFIPRLLAGKIIRISKKLAWNAFGGTCL